MQGMADKQSREECVGGTTIQEQYAEIFIDDKPVGKLSEKGDVDVSYSNVGDLTLTIDIDVSEAITKLKAIQREARDAAKALRELEEAQRTTVVDDIRRSYE